MRRKNDTEEYGSCHGSDSYWSQRDNEEWDQMTDRNRERHVLGMIEAGLAQAGREDRVLRLYQLYCDSGDETILGELLEQIRAMNRGIVSKNLQKYRFYKGNEETRELVGDIALMLMLLLRKEQAEGIRRDNILNLTRAFFKNKTVDAVRVKYRKHGWVFDPAREGEQSEDSSTPPGWRPGRNAVEESSWDALNTDEDDKPMDRIGAADATHDPEGELTEEKRYLSMVLQQLYLRALLSYGKEPYKAIALCYTRVLYHVERMFDPEEIQRAGLEAAAKDTRKKVSGYDKMITGLRLVQTTTTATAPKWAVDRMGSKNLLELTEDSQRSLQKNVDESLGWSDHFRTALEGHSGIRGLKWKDVVLTREYSYKQISKLAESIHTAVFHAAQRRMRLEHPELMEEAVRLGFRFWLKGMPDRKENEA